MIPIITRILPVARATPPEKFVKIRRQLFELSRGQIDGQRRKRNIFGGFKNTAGVAWLAGRPAGWPACQRVISGQAWHTCRVSVPHIYTHAVPAVLHVRQRSPLLYTSYDVLALR